MWHAPATRRSNRTILADAPRPDKFGGVPPVPGGRVIIDVPERNDPLGDVWGELVPGTRT